MAALVKSGCHHQYDVEGSFQRIAFKAGVTPLQLPFGVAAN